MGFYGLHCSIRVFLREAVGKDMPYESIVLRKGISKPGCIRAMFSCALGTNLRKEHCLCHEVFWVKKNLPSPSLSPLAT